MNYHNKFFCPICSIKSAPSSENAVKPKKVAAWRYVVLYLAAFLLLSWEYSQYFYLLLI